MVGGAAALFLVAVHDRVVRRSGGVWGVKKLKHRVKEKGGQRRCKGDGRRDEEMGSGREGGSKKSNHSTVQSRCVSFPPLFVFLVDPLPLLFPPLAAKLEYK